MLTIPVFADSLLYFPFIFFHSSPMFYFFVYNYIQYCGSGENVCINKDNSRFLNTIAIHRICTALSTCIHMTMHIFYMNV